MVVLCFIRKKQLQKAGRSLARWPGSMNSYISAHRESPVIVRNTSGCPVLLEILLVSYIFWCIYLSLPTSVEGRSTSFLTLPTSPASFFQYTLPTHFKSSQRCVYSHEWSFVWLSLRNDNRLHSNLTNIWHNYCWNIGPEWIKNVEITHALKKKPKIGLTRSDLLMLSFRIQVHEFGMPTVIAVCK